MIARLILRHEILHNLVKPLLVTVALVTLVMNILAFQMAQSGSGSLVEGPRGLVAQFAFLVPLIMILVMGKVDMRCRPWESGLPLPARSLWWAHLGAVVLSNLFLILVTGLAFVGFGSLVGIFANEFILKMSELAHLIARPAAASLTAASLFAFWRPTRAHLAGGREWGLFLALIVVVAFVLLGLFLALPPLLMPVVLVVAWTLVWQKASLLPPVLDWARKSPVEPNAEPGECAWPPVKPSRRIVLLVVMRTLAKWPVSWLVLAPIAAAFGLMMSGAHNLLGMDEPYMRFLNVFMSVYLLFAMNNKSMENLYRVDHLPISRRAILRWILVPVILFFCTGYGIGTVWTVLHPETAEQITFQNGPEGYGLKVPPEVFSFKTSPGPRDITSPWGETHQAEETQVFRFIPGMLWKSFSTPEGSSRQFVAWQISRAASEVYGLDLDPEEISSRYLEVDSGGRVSVLSPGLTIAADYPEARVKSSGPVFPLLVGVEIILLMLVCTIYFSVFKPGCTIRKSRVVFWGLMGGLMGLHIWGYVMFILGWTRDWLVSGFWLGRIRELGDLGTAGYGAAWVGGIVLVGLAYRLAERTFLSVEAPSS